MKKLFFAAILSIFTVFTTNALADINTTTQEDQGYGYEFDDDPLNAGGFGDKDLLIRVRPKAWRVTLIRPRVNFIPELIKSIEEL